LEINRHIFEVSGQSAAEKHMNDLAKRWPAASEVARAGLELRIALAGANTSDALAANRAIAIAEPIFLPVLLRFCILATDHRRATGGAMSLIEKSSSDQDQYAAF